MSVSCVVVFLSVGSENVIGASSVTVIRGSQSARVCYSDSPEVLFPCGGYLSARHAHPRSETLAPAVWHGPPCCCGLGGDEICHAVVGGRQPAMVAGDDYIMRSFPFTLPAAVTLPSACCLWLELLAGGAGGHMDHISPGS